MPTTRIKAELCPSDPPTWEEYWYTVHNDDWQAARALAECSPSIQRHLTGYLSWELEPVMIDDPEDEWHQIPDPSGDLWCDSKLDWEACAKLYDDEGLGFSSTELRLLDIVLALALDDRLLNIKTTLPLMGSWSGEVWRILTEWGTDRRHTTVPQLTAAGRNERNTD